MHGGLVARVSIRYGAGPGLYFLLTFFFGLPKLQIHVVVYIFLDISLENSTYIRLQHRNFSLHTFSGG